MSLRCAKVTPGLFVPNCAYCALSSVAALSSTRLPLLTKYRRNRLKLRAPWEGHRYATKSARPLTRTNFDTFTPRKRSLSFHQVRLRCTAPQNKSCFSIFGILEAVPRDARLNLMSFACVHIERSSKTKNLPALAQASVLPKGSSIGSKRTRALEQALLRRSVRLALRPARPFHHLKDVCSWTKVNKNAPFIKVHSMCGTAVRAFCCAVPRVLLLKTSFHSRNTKQ